MSDTEARVVVRLRERTGGQRSVRDRPPRWDGEAPPDDLGQAIVDTLAHLGDLIAEFQDRIADEAYLGSGRPKRDHVDRPRGAESGAPASGVQVVVTMRDAASADRLARELDANDAVETAAVETGPPTR
ncbi:hypothetical protein [Agromyces sp. NPDC055661]